MFEKAVHYEASDKLVGTVISNESNQTCPVVSAGHIRHEYTTGTSFDKIIAQFKYTRGVSQEGFGLIEPRMNQQ